MNLFGSAISRNVLVAMVGAAAANVILLLLLRTYDFRIGPLHFVAHGIYKPLLILNGAFLLCALARRSRASAPQGSQDSGHWLQVAAACFSVLPLVLAFSVEALYDEWNYRELSASWKTTGDLTKVFVSSQIGAWYRPLGFVSLWADSVVFDAWLCGYHVQNVLLHVANVWLIYLLSKRLGLTEGTARWGAILFAAASVAYEPIMWPSARFDLLAAMFTLAALLAGFEYLRRGTVLWLFLSLGCYGMGVLSKESAYAFPLLAGLCLPFAMHLRGPNGVRRPPVRLIAMLAGGVFAVTVGMLAMRLSVVGGLGGYTASTAGGSPHLAFSFAAVRSVVTKAVPMSLWTVNLVHPTPLVISFAIGGFAVLFAIGAIAGVASTPGQRILLACSVAAMLPVFTIVGWLDETAQHTRDLYLPGIFMSMFVAAAFGNARWPSPLSTGFVLLSVCCGFYNMWVYKNAYRWSAELASGIAADYSHAGDTAGVRVFAMPPEFNGVLFSQFELQYRVQRALPGVPIEFRADGPCDARLCYSWNADTRRLSRVYD